METDVLTTAATVAVMGVTEIQAGVTGVNQVTTVTGVTLYVQTTVLQITRVMFTATEARGTALKPVTRDISGAHVRNAVHNIANTRCAPRPMGIVWLDVRMDGEGPSVMRSALLTACEVSATVTASAKRAANLVTMASSVTRSALTVTQLDVTDFQADVINAHLVSMATTAP